MRGREKKRKRKVFLTFKQEYFEKFKRKEMGFDFSLLPDDGVN